jgi:hypothetical protein
MIGKFKITSAITCEHIVESADKKHTLINTYSGNVLMSEFPGTIFIAFYVEFTSKTKQEINSEIALYLGNKVAVRGKSTLKFDGVNPLVAVIPAGVLQVEKPSTMKLMFTANGGKPIKLIEKKFIPIGDSPIA